MKDNIVGMKQNFHETKEIQLVLNSIIIKRFKRGLHFCKAKWAEKEENCNITLDEIMATFLILDAKLILSIDNSMIFWMSKVLHALIRIV